MSDWKDCYCRLFKVFLMKRSTKVTSDSIRSRVSPSPEAAARPPKTAAGIAFSLTPLKFFATYDGGGTGSSSSPLISSMSISS